MSKTIGDILNTLRFEAGFDTLGQLHKASGVTTATLSRIINNLQKPTTETLRKLAPCLGVTHEFLLDKAGYIDSNSKLLPEQKKPQDLKKILEQHEIWFDGAPISEEAKQDILHIVEFDLYKKAKAMNKRKPKGSNSNEQ